MDSLSDQIKLFSTQLENASNQKLSQVTTQNKTINNLKRVIGQLQQEVEDLKIRQEELSKKPEESFVQFKQEGKENQNTRLTRKNEKGKKVKGVRFVDDEFQSDSSAIFSDASEVDSD